MELLKGVASFTKERVQQNGYRERSASDKVKEKRHKTYLNEQALDFSFQSPSIQLILSRQFLTTGMRFPLVS